MTNQELLTPELVKYCLFLDEYNQKLNAFFQQQKPYIFCKEGCCKCCQRGAYPCSELEFKLMRLGIQSLDDETKEIIKNKVQKIKQEKSNFVGEKFNYECPFLINNKCSIYLVRPIVCRNFGLAQFRLDGSLYVPFCVDEGLNYHQVYDKARKNFSVELFKKTGYTQEPLAYNLGLKFVIKEYGENQKGLDFGEMKTIIDFL